MFYSRHFILYLVEGTKMSIVFVIFSFLDIYIVFVLIWLHIFYIFEFGVQIPINMIFMFECAIYDEFKLVVVVDGGASVRDCMQNYCWKCMNSHHRGAREWQHLTEATLMLEWATKHEVRVPWSGNLGTILWCWFLRVFRHRCKILKTK